MSRNSDIHTKAYAQVMSQAVGDGSIDYNTLKKMSDSLHEQSMWKTHTHDALVSGTSTTGFVENGLSSSPAKMYGGSEPVDISNRNHFIQEIIKTRHKLVDFLDGSNILLQILDPQSIRETVKELRWDIREIKKNQNITECDVVEYMENEYGEQERRSDIYGESMASKVLRYRERGTEEKTEKDLPF